MPIQAITEDLVVVGAPIVVVHVSDDGALGVALFRQPVHATKRIKEAGCSDKDAAEIHDDMLADAVAGVMELLRKHTKLPKEDLLKMLAERMGKSVLPDGPCACPICKARAEGTFVQNEQRLPS